MIRYNGRKRSIEDNKGKMKNKAKIVECNERLFVLKDIRYTRKELYRRINEANKEEDIVKCSEGLFSGAGSRK